MPRREAEPAPRIGAHTSIAGSLDLAAGKAVASGCNALQIFSRSPRMWREGRLDPAGVERFKAARAEHGLWPLVIHGNYLMNMASADALIREKSQQAFRGEIERALTLGADYLVIHPGSYRGQTLNRALRVLSGSVAGAVRGVRWNGLQLLLENTAGGGMSIGRDFDELAELRSVIERKAAIPVGFCIDTAHCYQAGLDVSTAEGLETTLQRIERSVGLDGVCVLHANDSKTALGSRHDRHANIGLGRLGREAFRRMLRDPRLRGKPFILETPAGEDGTHRRDVATLKALARRRRTLQN